MNSIKALGLLGLIFINVANGSHLLVATLWNHRFPTTFEIMFGIILALVLWVYSLKVVN